VKNTLKVDKTILIQLKPWCGECDVVCPVVGNGHPLAFQPHVRPADCCLSVADAADGRGTTGGTSSDLASPVVYESSDNFVAGRPQRQNVSFSDCLTSTSGVVCSPFVLGSQRGQSAVTSLPPSPPPPSPITSATARSSPLVPPSTTMATTFRSDSDLLRPPQVSWTSVTWSSVTWRDLVAVLHTFSFQDFVRDAASAATSSTLIYKTAGFKLRRYDTPKQISIWNMIIRNAASSQCQHTAP